MKCDHLEQCSHCKVVRDLGESVIWHRVSDLDAQLEGADEEIERLGAAVTGLEDLLNESDKKVRGLEYDLECARVVAESRKIKLTNISRHNSDLEDTAAMMRSDLDRSEKLTNINRSLELRLEILQGRINDL